MNKKIFRLISLSLAVLTICSSFVGCKTKKKEEGPLTPEKQIFEDSYDRNADITEFMTYATDYITNDNGRVGKMDVYNLFDLAKIQVDNWENVTVGKTKMGELVKIIDAANENYVKTNTQSIVDERQAEIDKEYNEAKAAAEKKGKEYKKEKKKVRTDDIHFDNPYAYTVKLGTSNKVVAEEYKGTYLVDPTKCKNISFDVTKYGIPYVHFDFAVLNGYYNTKITQESDWVMNGIQAADVSTYVLGDAKTQRKNKKNGVEPTLPAYYDADGRNKAAKKNIIMSGDIAFSGDGFNWDSLMIFCNALSLGEKQKKQGFVQSSDDNFAYYTITLCTNPENTNEYAFSDESVVFPTMKLVATFDKLTQVCLNWTVDTYTSSIMKINGKNHDVIKDKKVNVHNFQVDTNNYSGMRTAVNAWIDEHSAGKMQYCAFDTSKSDNKKQGFIGVVNTGLTNATIEPVIDNVQYVCLSSSKNGDDIVGTFITKEDNDKAATMGDKQASYINSHKKNLKISCAFVDDKGNVVCNAVNDKKTMTGLDGTVYQVARLDYANGEYKDAAILTSENTYKLLMFYINTYELTSAQSDEMTSVFEESGLIGVRQYVDNLFAEAEEKQNKIIEAKNKEGKDVIQNVFDGSTIEIDKKTKDKSSDSKSSSASSSKSK